MESKLSKEGVKELELGLKYLKGGGEADITTTCPEIGFIGDLFVSEDYRRMDIGTELIHKAEEYFRELNCDYVGSGNVHTVNCLSGSVLMAEHSYGEISP